MSLAAYHQKRNFHRTPEPAGDRPPEKPGQRFVVQEHHARRRHYDFRLELDGVLKSWAVPKGPCLDPQEKRLAVEVEDHPVEYAQFEGIIPAGEYGAGTVLLWDQGTWQAEGDPREALRKGRLTFTLAGQKLRGSWTLVRTRGQAGQPTDEWLLIKRRDGEARPLADYDVLAALPLSVASGRTVAQIAASGDRVWTAAGERRAVAPRVDWSARLAALAEARRADMPSRVVPALAQLASAAPEGDSWLHEIKFDGYRLLARRAGAAVTLTTRGGHDWTGRFPALAADLGGLPAEPFLLDGELVALHSDGRSSFTALQTALSEGRGDGLYYQAFDLLYLAGHDLRRVPLDGRKELLAALLATAGPRLRYTDHVAGRGGEFFAQACQMGLEGIVSKRRDAGYPSGRRSAWLKVKCHTSDDFFVGGFTHSQAAAGELGALLLGERDDQQRLVYVGRVGTGFSARLAEDLRRRLETLRQPVCPFAEPPSQPRRPAVQWVAPELLVRVKYAGWTADRLLRHASWEGLREDLAPADVPPPPSAPPPAAAQALLTPARLAAHEAVLAEARLTHPDRVLYPEQGVTKLDLAGYYVQVAEWILPHLAGRPVSLVRCPQGRQGQCFFQRHAREGTPAQLRRVLIAEKRKREPYLVVDDLAGLLSLVQMGVLELHPWGARADRIEQPDRLIFDLDPDPTLPWAEVIAAARQVQQLLGDLGLVGFLKTSGGKGLHIVLPLVRRQGWPEVKQLARAVADRLVADAPGRFTSTMAKTARQGKVFIDYLRNDRGATAVAPFSPRARPGAPVSTPLAWEELTPTLRSDHFTLLTLPGRLATTPDPWADFFSVRQSLTQTVLRKLHRTT